MIWYIALQFSTLPLLALTTTTVDQIAVWGALTLVIGLIAWREYTLPEIAPAHARSADRGREAGVGGAVRPGPAERVSGASIAAKTSEPEETGSRL